MLKSNLAEYTKFGNQCGSKRSPCARLASTPDLLPLLHDHFVWLEISPPLSAPPRQIDIKH